jgi:hypothetical protein
MATYYVRKTGSNSNNGLSAGAAWATFGKALSTATGGDTVYIGAGVYRESVTVTSTTASTLSLIGDVDGAQTGDAGEVRWTAFTTDDKTTSSSVVCNLNGKDNLSFSKITFHGAGNHVIDAQTTADSINISFTDCYFIHMYSNGGHCVTVSSTGAAAANWTFDRCRFLANHNSSGNTIKFNFTAGTARDNTITIQNCLFIGFGGDAAILFQGVSVYGGGGKVVNCTFVGYNYAVSTASWTSSFPAKVYSCFIVAANTGINAGATNHIDQDYNLIYAPTATVNTSGGTNNHTTDYCPLVHIGQELFMTGVPRPFLMPTQDSPLLGFGSNASFTTSVDILNRPRPSGSGFWSSTAKGVGCLERHEIGVKETTTFDSSPTSLKVTGPGDHAMAIPVDAASTTISIKARWDSNYVGTLPQLKLEANGEIGVSAQSVTATGSANTWNTISLSAFTPTAKGWVNIFLTSNSTAGNGIVYWDTLTVS